MGGDVYVDTDAMGTIVPQLQEVGEKILGLRSGLINQLAPLENAAGIDDQTARLFYGSYTPTLEQILGALLDFSGTMDGVLTGVSTMIRGYTQTEEINTVPDPDGAASGGPELRHGSGK